MDDSINKQKIKRWNQVKTELSSALDEWKVLTKDLENKLSPEQEQIQEVKRLLGELKNKIKELE